MSYYLLGKKLSHSYSELLHAYRGLDYSLYEVGEADLKGFICGGDYEGLNVTIPYKGAVLPFLDGADELSHKLGAVNTVVNENGKKWGYNTDYEGFLKTFGCAGIEISGKKALVLGTGGAARTAVAALSDAGAKSVVTVSRTGEVNYDNVYDKAGNAAEIIVNATPVGTTPDIDDAPIDISRFPKAEFVFDLIYNPQKTRLLFEAEKLGLKCSNGLKMLVTQALCSEKLWTGADFSEKDVSDCERYLRYRTTPLALVGMPSAGKTTIGRLVAKKLGREFCDCDEEFSRAFGESPAECIVREGEARFREKESEVLKSLLTRRGAVVATGGGAVTVGKNTERLARNAFTVFVRRPLEMLETRGRPLSERRGIETLYAERKEAYERAADHIADNAGDAEECAKEIVKAYENMRYKRT